MTLGKLNDKSRVTMNDVAREAGLTRQTVSKYLNGGKNIKPDSARRIDAACEKLNYVPNIHAVNLVKGHSNIIGMVIPAVTDPFFGEIIRFVESEANDRGYQLIYQCAYKDSEKEAAIIQSFRSLDVSAFIITPSQIRPNRRLLSNLEKNYRVVYIENILKNNCHYVVNDNFHSGVMITEHVVSKGVKPVFLSHPYVNYSIKGRQEAYLHVCKKNNIKPRLIPLNIGDYSWQTEWCGYENVLNWLNEGNSADGLICATDRLAFGAMKALQQKKYHIGKDILVTGHDDLNYASFTNPPLTTVRQPKEQMGKAVISTLLDKLENKGTSRKFFREKYFSELIVRQSA